MNTVAFWKVRQGVVYLRERMAGTGAASVLETGEASVRCQVMLVCKD